jgi:hypothetical protein
MGLSRLNKQNMKLTGVLTGIFLSIASFATAQTVYENSCDPAQYIECRDLSDRYVDGVAPFPQDPERAKVLLESALSYARANCGTGQGQTCRALSQHYMILSHTEGTPREDYLQQLLSLRALAKTGCAANDPAACAFLAMNTTLDYRDLHLFALMAATRGADDRLDQLDQLRTDLSEEEAMWSEQAQTLAQARFDALRPNCNSASPEICGEMGDIALHINNPDPDRLSLYHKACLGGAPQYCKPINWASIGFSSQDALDSMKVDLENACNTGLAEACAARADNFSFDAQDRAAPFHDRACTLGHVSTCALLGRKAFSTYRKSIDPKDLQHASDLLETACTGGDTLSCHYIEHISKG